MTCDGIGDVPPILNYSLSGFSRSYIIVRTFPVYPVQFLGETLHCCVIKVIGACVKRCH